MAGFETVESQEQKFTSEELRRVGSLTGISEVPNRVDPRFDNSSGIRLIGPSTKLPTVGYEFFSRTGRIEPDRDRAKLILQPYADSFNDLTAKEKDRIAVYPEESDYQWYYRLFKRAFALHHGERNTEVLSKADRFFRYVISSAIEQTGEQTLTEAS